MRVIVQSEFVGKFLSFQRIQGQGNATGKVRKRTEGLWLLAQSVIVSVSVQVCVAVRHSEHKQEMQTLCI